MTVLVEAPVTAAWLRLQADRIGYTTPEAALPLMAWALAPEWHDSYRATQGRRVLEPLLRSKQLWLFGAVRPSGEQVVRWMVTA